jgi:heme/copper-type cytochrome/quinol oxidase subunit 1
MNIRSFLIRFVVYFAVSFTVNAVVIYVWNIFQKSDTIFRWEQAFVIAIFIGAILSLTRELGERL